MYDSVLLSSASFTLQGVSPLNESTLSADKIEMPVLG